MFLDYNMIMFVIAQSADILPPDRPDDSVIMLNEQIAIRDAQIKELNDSIQKLNEDHNMRTEELNAYIRHLIEERNTFNKIVDNQSNIYECAQGLLSDVQSALNQRPEFDDIQNLMLKEHIKTKDEAIYEIQDIQKKIMEFKNVSDVNMEIEIAYFRELQKNLDLQLKVNNLHNQLRLAKEELELQENINRQLSESANKIKQYINQITNIVNSSKVIENSNEQEMKYYIKTIDELSNQLSQIKNQLELNVKRNKDQESQINILNRSLEYYESLNNINAVDLILEYICKVYSAVYKTEHDIIQHIKQSEISNECKNILIDLVGKIREDQYIRNVNLNIVTYIVRTQELKKYLSSLKFDDIKAIQDNIDKYMNDIDKLGLKGSSIDKNNSLINNYKDKIANKQYDIKNVLSDARVLSESINIVRGDDIKLDITKVNLSVKKIDTFNSLLQKKINLLLNLIILFNMSDLIKDRKILEDNLEKYNYYVNLLSRISKNKYDIYSDVPNNKIIENMITKININIREYINAIGVNSSEHPYLTSLSINLKDICGDNSNVNIKYVHKVISNIENIFKKEVGKLTPNIKRVLQNIQLNEIYVILELFANKL